MGWLEEMLNWPAEWSTLHGSAERKTGIVKLASASDFTEDNSPAGPMRQRSRLLRSRKNARQKQTQRLVSPMIQTFARKLQ